MIEYPSVAVAMSVYKSDTLELLTQSVNSILNQTYRYFHFFIEVDGNVNLHVKKYLHELSSLSEVTVCFHEENRGLATRLNQIIDKAVISSSFSYLARMDADDISSKNRLEVQVNYLLNNSDIFIVGTDVVEIDIDNNDIFYKKMESSNNKLIKNIIRKCPFNHPTVMFNMSVFTEYSLRYRDDLMNTQDYYLWVDAIYNNIKIANINMPLLKFRVDKNFHKRRGFKKSMNEFKSRIYAMRKLKILTVKNIFHSILLLCLRLSPECVKKLAYKTMR